MSLYDRKLPTTPAATRPVETGRFAKCPACLHSPGGLRFTLDGHTGASVWAALDEDRCPCCNAHLVLGQKLREKRAIAVRLLGTVGPHRGGS